jgi:ATP synthase protein I
MKESKGNPYRAAALMSGIGLQLVSSVLLGLYLGRYLDTRFHTGPWLMIAGILLGMTAGITGVIVLAQRFMGDS